MFKKNALKGNKKQQKRCHLRPNYRFESLTTSLQHGLPAEIAARRQQYEYYRDKLLDFKRKTA